MKKLFDLKEHTLIFFAVQILKSKNMEITESNILSESGKLERIAEKYYIESKSEEYNTFIIKWLIDNINKIFNTQEFSYDVRISDKGYENNLDNYIK